MKWIHPLCVGMVLATAAQGQIVATVEEARALPEATVVTIENLVITNTTDLISSPTVASVHAQDATGGATIFGRTQDIDAILAVAGEGDEITIVEAETDFYNGLFELNVYGLADRQTPWFVESTGSPGIPEPEVITIADLQDGSPTAEGLENKFVRINNVSFEATGTFSGGANYTISDGSGSTAVVRVSTAALDIVGDPIPQGNVSFTAIFSQFSSSIPDAGYQLLIRGRRDFRAPLAIGQTVETMEGAPITITLEGIDNDPGPQPLVYEIRQLPQRNYPTQTTAIGGVLTDPANGNAVVGENGALAGNQVTFTPAANTSGWFVFTFTVTDSVDTSPAGVVHIFVQEADSPVVISEIMYDPSNFPDSDWEWVEITNNSGGSVALDTLFDARLMDDAFAIGNLGGSIAAGSTRVIMNGQITGETTISPTDFANEWGLQLSDLIIVNRDSGLYAMPLLNNDGDKLYLFAADGRLLDVVDYKNGVDGWPAGNNASSIYVDYGHITSADNDIAANWRLSILPNPGSQVVATPETAGPPIDQDLGSPAALPTSATAALTPPQIFGESVLVNAGSSTLVTLSAVGDPEGEHITFQIVENFAPIVPNATTDSDVASMLDPGTGQPVTAGDALTGNQLLITPKAGVSGLFGLGVSASDGESSSPMAYVEVYIQSNLNRGVITEIMYNPANLADNDWEWIEVTNFSAQPIDLHSFWDANAFAYLDEARLGNLLGSSIPAGSTRIIARDQITQGRTLTEFLNEWQLDASEVITVPSPTFADWPSLNNGGDTIYLFAADGSLLDVVSYADVSPWPTDDGSSSIYAMEGSLNTLANDDGANWALSVAGVDGAYETLGNTTLVDIGSPGIVPGGVTPDYAPADFNQDGFVDDADYGIFEECATGPAMPYSGALPANCTLVPEAGVIAADFDADDDVDGDDFGIVQRCFSGTALADVNCAD